METEKKPVDALNREIMVGDLVVYPVRRGSAMWLNRLMVQHIKGPGVDGEFALAGINKDGRLVQVASLDRCAIVFRKGAQLDASI